LSRGWQPRGFGAATNFGAGTNPISVAVGDFNGDGKQDLAVANMDHRSATVIFTIEEREISEKKRF
jgi:hypothetical protein